MANDTFSIFHDNVLSASTVTATGISSDSSVSYLSDDRVSFKFQSEGNESAVLIDQPVTSGSTGFKTYQYAVLADHDLQGGEILIQAFPTSARVTPTTTLSVGTIPSTDPTIMEVDSATQRLGDQFLTVELTGAGGTHTVGELMLVNKFDSPKGPARVVPSSLVPKRNFFELPNGERLSIKRGGTPRMKQYDIRGLTLAESDSWTDVYETNAGSAIVILDDERGANYPAIMNERLNFRRENDFVNMQLSFQELVIS